MTPVTQREIERLRGVLGERLGLRFDDDKASLLEGVLCARLRATGLRDAETYLDWVARDSEEIGELASACSVGETYFFRYRNHFRVLEAFLRDHAAPRGRRLCVLSAGCATGEEPYSVAILACEVLGDSGHYVSIVGLDFDRRALARARLGRYDAWSLRETTPEVRRKYFRDEGERHVLDAEIRSMVDFEQRNLVESDSRFWRRDSFDVALCRNVLMYLRPDCAADVVRSLERALRPGGVLFLGHAETLRGATAGFHLVQSHGCLYYVRGSPPVERERSALPADSERLAARAGAAAEAPPSRDPDRTWLAEIARAADRIHNLVHPPGDEATPGPQAGDGRPAARDTLVDVGLAKAMALLRKERYRDALQALPVEDEAPAGAAEVRLVRAVLRLATGDMAGSERECRGLLELDDLHAGAHYVLALCRDHAGDPQLALDHDRIAAYLDNGFALPHLHAGLLLRRRGEMTASRRELALARGLLAGETDERIVLYGGGFAREGLIAICDAQLAAGGGDR